jgi:hypothetical protein
MDKNCCFDETVIFFDWDDTCFPSTFLTNKGFRLDSHPDTYAHFVEALRELETCVGEMLRLAMQCGTVVIVTNAERGWVELSSQVPHCTHAYLPKLAFFRNMYLAWFLF